MRFSQSLLPLVAAAVLMPVAAWPQQHPPMYASSAAGELKPLSPAQKLERRFLQITAANMRLQAEGSRLAATRSNNAAVKALAQAVLARQKTAQPELLHLLAARGMAMPLAGNARLMKQLTKLNGAKFDRVYVDDVLVRTWHADVANFEKVATQAEDPVLKAWAERQLPTLRAHLVQAERALPGSALRGQRAV